MAYLLYYNNEVYGCYGKVDLLRANILIIIFKLLEKNKITKLDYENIANYLDIEVFTIDSFSIPELKSELRRHKIRIEKIVHENSSSCALEHILEHVKFRFSELTKIMKKDSRIKVTFPGQNAERHELGEPYKNQWKLFDETNYERVTEALHDFIMGEIIELEEKFPERVIFGEVTYRNASPVSYQVWSANAVNWNRPEGMDIPGSFQAQEMKFQEKGVFGIVVTPRYGYKNLIPPEFKEKLNSD